MPRPESMQYMAFGLLSLFVIGLTAIQVRLDAAVYRPYLGPIPPVPGLIGVSVVGVAIMSYLMTRSQFVVFARSSAVESGLFILKVVPVFAVVAIAADLIWRHPEGLNVPLPDALFFYPSIGFVVEVCLHALPLAVLVIALGSSGTWSERRFWAVAFAIAAIEAVIQVSAGGSSPALATVTGAYLLVFGAVQIYVFRRFGFLSMYAFRLTYYALWHLAWGTARLHLLF